MQNLNKENFWNALEQKYPVAMQRFKEWIDAYKNEVDWSELFAEYEVKLHDIPIEMQLGILLRFVAESLNDMGSYNSLMSIKYLGGLVESCFRQIEHK